MCCRNSAYRVKHTSFRTFLLPSFGHARQFHRATRMRHMYNYMPRLSDCLSVTYCYCITRVSAAAERPALRRGSAHAKYSVSHHMVIKPRLQLGQAAEYRSRRWVWSTVVRRPSEVYDTYRRTKLTAPETISRSRDVENRRLNLPTSIGRPVGVTPLECCLDFWHQKTRVPGLSYGVVYVILAVWLSQVGVLLRHLNLGSRKQRLTIAQEF